MGIISTRIDNRKIVSGLTGIPKIASRIRDQTKEILLSLIEPTDFAVEILSMIFHGCRWNVSVIYSPPDYDLQTGALQQRVGRLVDNGWNTNSALQKQSGHLRLD